MIKNKNLYICVAITIIEFSFAICNKIQSAVCYLNTFWASWRTSCQNNLHKLQTKIICHRTKATHRLDSSIWKPEQVIWQDNIDIISLFITGVWPFYNEKTKWRTTREFFKVHEKWWGKFHLWQTVQRTSTKANRHRGNHLRDSLDKYNYMFSQTYQHYFLATIEESQFHSQPPECPTMLPKSPTLKQQRST